MAAAGHGGSPKGSTPDVTQNETYSAASCMTAPTSTQVPFGEGLNEAGRPLACQPKARGLRVGHPKCVLFGVAEFDIWPHLLQRLEATGLADFEDDFIVVTPMVWWG